MVTRDRNGPKHDDFAEPKYWHADPSERTFTGPVILAPAMNVRMWENPILQSSVAKLTELGYRMVGPGEGWLACRTVGSGRMAEPEEILDVVIKQLMSAPPKGLVKSEVRSEK